VGYDWRRELQEIHVDVLMGRRANFGTRVTYLEMAGIGDRLRAAGASVVFATLAGKAPMLKWRREPSDNEDLLLNELFLPRQFYWNASDASTTVLDDGSESVWDDYYPPGMAEERQRLSFTDVASMLGSSRIPDAIVDTMHNDAQKQQTVVNYLQNSNRNPFLNFLDPHRLYYGLSTNFQLTGWPTTQRSYFMPNTFGLDSDMVALRKSMVSIDRWTAKTCSIRMLFDTFAPPLRSAFSKSLEKLQQLAVSHAEKQDDDVGVNVTVTESILRMGDEKTACAGMSFSECLNVHFGVRVGPVIGMHYRNGDNGAFRPGHLDDRNPVELFPDFLKCAKAMAGSLGYDSPLYILATDNSRLKTAVNEWQSGPLLVDEVSINVPIDVIANTVVMPTAPPVHVSFFYNKHQKKDSVVDAMSEILLLASVDALMMTRSEFSFVASVFGGFPRKYVSHFNNGECWPRKHF